MDERKSGSLNIRPKIVTSLYRAVISVYHVVQVYNYAIRLDYAEEQIWWLDKLGPAFEATVVKHCVLDFTRALYKRWFKQWAERLPEGIACAEGSSKVHQRKIVSLFYPFNLAPVER